MTDAGLDLDHLHAVADRIADGTYVNVHSLLVARGGRLAFETYGRGMYEDGEERSYDESFVHCTHSVTKSVTSALVGIAIDQGLIEGVHVPLASLFEEYADVFTDSAKADITLANALAMTAGLHWDESSLPYTDPRNDHIAFVLADDPMRFLFELPLDHEPGATFCYNSGLSIALGRIIERAAGVRADEFARQHLFTALGIEEFGWHLTGGNLLQTGGGLSLRPRDMLTFGQLFLDGGRHDGRQVVPEAWVAESTTKQAPDWPYGYQWWLTEEHRDRTSRPLYAALGRGGQSIHVLPDLDMVVVMTAWNDGTLPEQGGRILADVLEAVTVE